jgi:5-methylcytosine-specific restriction endonuclease McrA
MTIKDVLKPHESPRVMDLVAKAGVDVAAWSISRRGPVATPASNPAYCYEWAHIERGRVVVLNLWHDELVELDGNVFEDLNPREWAEALNRASITRRATTMDAAIAYAFTNQLPVRVIVGDGTRRYLSDANQASRMKMRLLDPEPWTVERYDPATGATRLTRGSAPRFADQFSTREGLLPPLRRQVTGEAWVRDPAVRLAALRRAKGECELCSRNGFRTAAGEIYLETHHVLPLSEGGEDTERNVVALCANDHREAHHGEARDSIRERLRAVLARHLRERVPCD